MSRVIKFRAWHSVAKQMMEIEHLHLPTTTEHVFTGVHLMQFTGLTDKNGREIYEGDIYAEDYFSNVNPRDHSDNNYFDNKPRIKVVKWGKEMFLLSRGEVIGNIYENPELLSDREI